MSDLSAPPDSARLPRPDRVLVIGAGIIGRTCALQLARLGVSVTLLDDDARLQAPSWGNAGHIAIEQTAPLASPDSVRQAWARWYGRGGPMDIRRPWAIVPWLTRFLAASKSAQFTRGQHLLRELLADAMPAWRRLDALLPSSGHLLEDGHLVLWEHPERAEAGLRHWQNSDIGQTRLRPVHHDESRWLDSAVGAYSSQWRGIGFEGSGQIRDPYQLAADLDAALARLGVERRSGHAISLASRQGRSVALTTEGELPSHDRILVCTGARSAGLLEPLGEVVPLIAERGYHLQWSEHDWPSSLPPVVFEDRSVILTRFKSGLRLAGFVEFAPFDTAPDPGKWQRLARHAQELGLPVRGEPRQWMGARPTLADYLPALGRTRQAPDVFYAVGHQHLGLTLAATTAEHIARLMLGQSDAAWLAGLSLSRFRRS
ncbi:NAD(P)/FAD-dependent oxidoreductase [Frateuria aurantia]